MSSKRNIIVFAICIIVTSGILLYGSCIEPYSIEVNHVSIKDSGLKAVIEDTVIVQLSDLHIREIGQREKKVLQILDELKPDIIFLTGDYVTWNGEYKPALRFLTQLNAKIGIWAVMGDYDYSRSRKSCAFCHEEGSGRPTRQHAVRFLKDGTEQISVPGGSLSLLGLDGQGGTHVSTRHPLPLPDVRGPVILLSHSPLVFDSIPLDQDILVLAGDTHGGQIPLPVPAWFLEFAGYEKNARYNQGLFEQGRKKMFVSRGIGMSHFPSVFSGGRKSLFTILLQREINKGRRIACTKAADCKVCEHMRRFRHKVHLCK